MARTIDDIMNALLAEKASHAELNTLNSTSNVAVWRLLFYIVATAIWMLENLFDIFKTDVTDIIANLKPHTPQWYVIKVKEFQYGYNLVPEKDYYDNTGIDDATIAASKIVAYAAFVENPFVRMKLAKLSAGVLAPLTSPERAAVVAYILRVKDAGVKLKDSTITSSAPDKLKLTMRIKYNPLVLNAAGNRIDGTSATPVPDGLRAFLTNFNFKNFNGVFSVQKMIDALQAIEGVNDLAIDLIQKKYGALPFTTVDIDFVPDAGYLIIDNADLAITYIPS